MMTTNNFLLLFLWSSLYGCIAFWLLIYMCYMVHVYWITLIWVGRAVLPRMFRWYEYQATQRVLAHAKRTFLYVFIPLALCGIIFCSISSIPRLGTMATGFYGFVHRMSTDSILGFKQTPEFMAIANYVLIYGTFHLSVILCLSRMSNWIDTHPRWRWLRRLSVFNGWAEFSNKSGTDKFKAGLCMLLRYIGSWMFGLMVVSPISLLIPGFWDPVIAIPETVMVVLAGLVWLPLVISLICVRTSLIPMIRDAMFCRRTKADLIRFYRLVIVPIVCVIAGATLWFPYANDQNQQKHTTDNAVVTVTANKNESRCLNGFSCPKCGHIHWPGAELISKAVANGLGLIMLVLSWGSLLCMMGGLRGSVACVTCWLVIALFIMIKDSIYDYYLILHLCR